ncbi:hypothetical protein [Methanocalculus sp.]|uniref:hypothetical protein n=1 Tax=Methanocalculus sp. TaxID=2004547 RepID=UPI00271E45CC|nr:hypothetical protein [Methanocalculus sp.]MDO8840975.1 hypothetical protein [Methanocalculus sp.]
MHRLLLIVFLLLLIPGCYTSSVVEAPPPFDQVEPPDDVIERISLDDALSLTEPPVYLIIGRDLTPDGTAASWTILSADPDGGYRFLFIRAGDVASARWEGKIPQRAIDPREFPIPTNPVPLLMYPEAF